MDMYWRKIEDIANNGIITTMKIEQAGIRRSILKKYVDQGLLTRIRNGLYILSDTVPDEYALIQARSEKVIFSYSTALNLWGLSDRVPHIIDITVPQGTNMTPIKRDNPHLTIHYVDPSVHEIGKCETKSPQGALISIYDRERCICDFIRNKNETDLQIYTQALKGYFRENANPRKLLKYAKVFKIEEKARTYMEVLL